MRIGRLTGGAIIALAGVVLGMAASQTVLPDLRAGLAADRLPARVTAERVAHGAIRGLDSIRVASGMAELLRAGDVDLLRLTGFAVAEAPDLEIWLSTDTGIATSGDVRAATARRIAQLRAARGDQVYLLPRGLDIAALRTVLFWCAEFGTLYGVAPPLEG